MESQEVSKEISLKEIFAHLIPAKNITKLVSLGFGIILISWLLAQLDLSATVEIIRNVPLSLVMLGFLCYALSFYLRAARFRLLLPPDQPGDQLFPIVLVHYTALNIIPARIGEISYVYLMKKIHGVSMGCSVSSLILARVFDQIAISSLFLISAGMVNISSQWLRTLSLIIGGFLISMFLMLMVLLIYKAQCASFITKLLVRFQWNRYALVKKGIQEMENIVTALDKIRIKENSVKILGISVLIWLSIFGVNYSLLHAFNVNLTFAAVMLSSTFSILLTLLPFQLLSGMGIRETAWMFIVSALGVPRNTAIVAAFGIHIVAVVYLVMFALYGFGKLSLVMKKREKKAPKVS